MTTTVPVLRCVVTVTVVRGDDLRSHGWRSKNQAPYVVVRAMQDLRPLCATERTSVVGGTVEGCKRTELRTQHFPPARPPYRRLACVHCFQCMWKGCVCNM